MAVVDVIGSLVTYITSHIHRRHYVVIIVVRLAQSLYSSIVDLNYFSLIFLESETWVM